VIAWRRTQLVALNPEGHRQWTLATHAQVTVARWSPDGYRIAYTAARSLRVVAGDGSGDHQLDGHVAPVPPAWQPHTGSEHRIAYLTQAGTIDVRDADTHALLWRSKPRARPQQLLWSPDGRRLLSVESHRLTLYNRYGHSISTTTIPPGDTAGPAAFDTDQRVALILRTGFRTAGSVALLDLSQERFHGPPKTLFTAPDQLTAVDWSPDHQWLITSSPLADQWFFIRVTPPARLSAVSEIARQFRPGRGQALGPPRLAGWQP
jgi:dipeptidyl aminopeptidase/acylaminoacyl peptidase